MILNLWYNISMKFESMRHGHKEGENLSERGKEQAKEKAKALLEEVQQSEAGTIFFVIPSNVGRAKETREIIETELRQLAASDSDIAFIDVHEAEQLAAAKGNFTKRYIITGIQPSRALGLHLGTQMQKTYLDLRSDIKDEDLVAKTWIAKPQEVSTVQDEVRSKFGEHIPLEKLRPERFEGTPEEAALYHIRLMKALQSLKHKYFPNHPAKALQVNHSPHADFAFMALAGKELSLKTVEEMGGKFRDFLEAANIDLQDDGITIEYRGDRFINNASLDEVIDALEKQADERKREWRKA
ncbi:hypothetical protein A3A67_00190 [Candidatus Peribacteria bacterium RIFCSPLOWO2_01_FULL_51_18]|nr:hypothetical protein [Candidatus Aenigmarchaeota archaeon]OGJ65313.1 MAG: hypothetical protein A3A67_00190 [Candidatus Peribacteria bacterium RIFCSPLOWO2_01_FULL_51_18]